MSLSCGRGPRPRPDRYYELTLRQGNRLAVAERLRQAPAPGGYGGSGEGLLVGAVYVRRILARPLCVACVACGTGRDCR